MSPTDIPLPAPDVSGAGVPPPQGTGSGLPCLRSSLEAVPTEHEGEPMFLLRDLEGLTQKSAALAPGGMLIASLMDGKRTALEIAALFAKSTGAELKADLVAKLAAELSDADLLETPRTARLRRQALQEFKDSGTRKAWHQGPAYPADVLELAKSFGEHLRDPKGPGKDLAPEPTAPAALGLFAPHIDFSRGGPSYAWAYQALSETRPPDAVVALGVSHMAPKSPWVLTRKSYETPHGPLAVDMGLYDDLRKALWYDPLEDEWVHRMEHSLEFQAVWLKHLWRDKAPAWVPILVSSFERFCPDRPPSCIPTVEGALVRIGEVLKARADSGARILILAGVDLAHVGPRFGDSENPTPEAEARIEAEDRSSLGLALSLKADEFYLSVVKDGNKRRVCGLSAVYTALRWMSAVSGGKASGRLLSYGQAPDPMGGIVSYSAAIFRDVVS
ncbi:MAG: AmmeMemoRadiSam system protein B [Elusimicrobia bacterium]|nr:AmmeMemoRadiSam system protein B [Elusimicrobiota bacterium]